MKATIQTVEDKGKTMLYVQCFEPMTKIISATRRPYDRELLESAVEVCSGASLRKVGYKHIPHPADFGDEQYDFVLDLTPANFLALKATGFNWSEEAIASVVAFSVSDESIKKVRDAAFFKVRTKQQQTIDQLQQVRCEQNHISHSKRRWWKFW